MEKEPETPSDQSKTAIKAHDATYLQVTVPIVIAGPFKIR